MAIQLFAFIIFIVSSLGIVFILYRKMPVLVKLPKNGNTGLTEHHLVENIIKKVREIAHAFERQIFLHKLLSWVKVMTLKLEVKVDYLLHGIRKKAQELDKETKKKSKKLPK